MKRKPIIWFIKIVLSLVLVSSILAGVFFLHMWSGNWWDRPSFGKDIDKIEIYTGSFRFQDMEPTHVIDPQSTEGSNIMRAVESGWYYWDPSLIKFGVHYSVDIIHMDNRVDSVWIGRDIFSVTSNDEGKGRRYRSHQNITEIIADVIKRSKMPNHNLQPTPLNAGDVTNAQGGAAEI